MSISPLKVDRLIKSYGDVKAVNDISFELKKGEVFGLLGPNGAGKTTLISCAVTLEKASSGKIYVCGHDVSKEPTMAKQKIGIVGQEIVNSGYFTVEEILHFHSGYYGIKNNHKRIEELIHELDLGPHRAKKVKQLSGGMKRRLMIAKALVHQPDLLLLDEPTAGVDVELRENLWKFVRRLQTEGITVLLTTHYLEEAEQLCDRVGVIHHGELKRLGPTKALIEELTQRQVKLTLSGGEQKTFMLKHKEKLNDRLKDHVQNIEQIEDLSIHEGTLEDAFRSIIGGGE